MQKVRVGKHYIFQPAGMDVWSGVYQDSLKAGDEVVVVNLPGAPKANVMGHCYVNLLDGTFGGLVLTNSLQEKCKHESTTTWTAYDGTLCEGCNKCGAVLKGGV